MCAIFQVSICTSAYSSEEDSSINTAQISYLVSKASSVYSLFSKKLRQQRNIHTSSPVLLENSKLEDHPADSKATVLMNEAAVQHQIIVQTCKALNICLSSKEFRSSIEYVEAEKILLLASKLIFNFSLIVLIISMESVPTTKERKQKFLIY